LSAIVANCMSEEENDEECVVIDPAEVFRHYGQGREFYSPGLEYWARQEATLHGMLDGRLNTSPPDIAFSKVILDKYVTGHSLGTTACVDVACGIGRISSLLLSKYFRRIDLVEPVAEFAAKAEADLRRAGIDARKHVCGAQDWHCDDDFDCFWLQWTLMFLTDDDCVALLRRCAAHLRPNGIIVVKENVVLSREKADALWWELDHSFSRALGHVCDLCVAAGLRIDFSEQQPDWDEELLPVQCLVLKPL
jgi:protein N-terminal methyltransferase